MCLTKFLLTPALTVMLAVGASASANDSANDILPTGTLPIVYIVTENGKPIVEKEEKIPAGFWIDPAQSGCAAFGSESNPVPFTVSGRGNYTWSGFDKKPYKVKFNEKQSLFNLPKSKHYALLAHADDARQGHHRLARNAHFGDVGCVLAALVDDTGRTGDTDSVNQQTL